jgi:hypothetical protein
MKSEYQPPREPALESDGHEEQQVLVAVPGTTVHVGYVTCRTKLQK